MLIRVRGYTEGVAEYLVNGQKSGREHHRDDLDERVILAGDLEMTDSLIQRIKSEGERYKTITLSFKEDAVSADVLRQIVAEFKDFAFAAYKDDEFNFYAEAHLPKIKSVKNELTSDPVERKPHIHIVVPKLNLLTWKYAEPFGYFELSEKYIAAFQEHINYKYGFASPQENRRSEFTDASEFISRYKGDDFKGSKHKTLLTEVREAMIQRGIVSYDGLRELLATYGRVSVGKEGRPDEYLKVILPGETKAVRFDHDHFRRDFIKLEPEAKRQLLTSEAHKRYEVARAARTTPAECAALMQEWRELRAKEVKYINSGYRSFYKQYQAMSRADKIAALAEREQRFYAKYQGEPHERTDHTPGADRAATFRRIAENLGATDRHIGAASRAARNLDQAAGNLADRTALRAVAAVIQRHSRHQTEGERNAGDRGEFEQRRRAADNVVGQLGAELQERQLDAKAQERAEFKAIKQSLEAGRLLAYLSKSHGVIPEKYAVTRGKDGSERIQCGARKLNVSDFLTKEMHLSWKDAGKILRECYAAQQGRVPAQIQRPPRRDLWSGFQEWKRSVAPQRSADAMATIREDRRVALSEAAQRFNVERGRIEDKRGITKGEQRRLIDIAKAERVHAQKLARDEATAKQAAERLAWRGEELYKRYLEETAQERGPLAEAALTELRKRQPDLAENEVTGAIIRAERPQPPTVEPIARDLTYRVDRAGHVTYRIAGQDALKDEGKRVRVLQASDANVIEEGLMLARAKFGQRITLHGTDEFKRQAVAIAVEKNLRVEFTDPALQRMKHELEQEKAERFRLVTLSRQTIQAEQAARDVQRFKEAEAQAARAAAERKAAEQPAPVAETRAPDPIAHAVEGPQNAPEVAPVPSVAESLPATKQYGRYDGEILSHDENFVYQQTARGVVHHRREQFKELPQSGEEVSIKYHSGHVQSVDEIGRDYGR